MPPTRPKQAFSDGYLRVLSAIGNGVVSVSAGQYTIGGGQADVTEVHHIRRAVERWEHADHDRWGRYFLTQAGRDALLADWPLWTANPRF